MKLKQLICLLLAAVVLLWLAEVRPQVSKVRSEIITDFLRAELIHDGETAEQVFTYDKDLLTIGLEFYLPGEQPSGTLEVVLYDADTGAELSRSVGTMDYIVPDQYTTLGLDPAVTGREGRRYRLTVTPHYTTDAILAVGHSDGVALWKDQMSVSGRAVDGTMAMQITYQRIGGYLTRFFLLVGGLAAVLAALPPQRGEHIYRLLLTGERGLEGLDLGELERELSPRFWGLTLRDHTRAARALWERKGEDTLTGLFLREMEGRCQAEPENEAVQLAVRFGLAALEHGEDVAL